jgi:mono/diheme cytochrome c family protein
MSRLQGRFLDLRLPAIVLGLAIVAAIVCGCPQKPAETTTGPTTVQPKTTPPPEKGTAVEPAGEKEKTESAKQEKTEEDVIPAEYASLKNPAPGDPKVIAAGKTLYAQHCAGCHGKAGKGDGPHAAKFNPKPADLTDPDMQKELTDPALFWRISEGVKGTGMPAFKTKADEKSRWAAVDYVRTLKPAQ